MSGVSKRRRWSRTAGCGLGFENPCRMDIGLNGKGGIDRDPKAPNGCRVVSCSTSQQHVSALIDGSAQITERAATLRQKLQIKLAFSPSRTTLTEGQAVADPITPGAGQCRHWSINVKCSGPEWYISTI